MPPLHIEDLNHVLMRTRENWESARGKSFFITGGTGFFGIWLLETFCHANDSMDLGMHATVLTRDPLRFAGKCPHLTNRTDLTFIRGDVRSIELPRKKFSYIIHAATEANSKINNEAPEDALATIVEGTRQVLNIAAKCGVEKLLLTSSGAVYGRPPLDLSRLSENYVGAPDPLLPGSAYGEGKRVSEHMCAVHALQHRYEVKIARCFAFVGPHLPLDGPYAAGNFIRDTLAGNPIRMTGDGSVMRSYLYAADLAIWLWRILCTGRGGTAYNVGSEKAITIRELAALIDSSGKPTPPPLAEPTVASSSARYIPDTTRARTELGLEEWTSLPEAIRKTFTWHHTQAS